MADQEYMDRLSAEMEADEEEDVLRSIINSPEVQAEVEALARPDVVYEHGQWWVKLGEAVFSVIDTGDGLDLEQC